MLWSLQNSKLSIENLQSCLIQPEKEINLNWKIIAVENFRGEVESFNKMKADGNLVEYDFEAIDEIEVEIGKIEKNWNQ